MKKNIITKNNLNSDSIRYIVFKEKSMWYAVALELNIVEAGNDPQVVLLSLFEAIHGYIKVAVKNKLDLSVLNQKVDKEYEKMWKKAMNQKLYILSNNLSKVYTFGAKTLITV